MICEPIESMSPFDPVIMDQEKDGCFEVAMLLGIRTLQMCAYTYLTILDLTGIHYCLENIFTFFTEVSQSSLRGGGRGITGS